MPGCLAPAANFGFGVVFFLLPEDSFRCRPDKEPLSFAQSSTLCRH